MSVLWLVKNWGQNSQSGQTAIVMEIDLSAAVPLQIEQNILSVDCSKNCWQIHFIEKFLEVQVHMKKIHLLTFLMMF